MISDSKGHQKPYKTAHKPKSSSQFEKGDSSFGGKRKFKTSPRSTGKDSERSFRKETKDGGSGKFSRSGPKRDNQEGSSFGGKRKFKTSSRSTGKDSERSFRKETKDGAPRKFFRSGPKMDNQEGSSFGGKRKFKTSPRSTGKEDEVTFSKEIKDDAPKRFARKEPRRNDQEDFSFGAKREFKRSPHSTDQDGEGPLRKGRKDSAPKKYSRSGPKRDNQEGSSFGDKGKFKVSPRSTGKEDEVTFSKEIKDSAPKKYSRKEPKGENQKHAGKKKFSEERIPRKRGFEKYFDTEGNQEKVYSSSPTTQKKREEWQRNYYDKNLGEEEMPLNKYISHCDVCSRRAAADLVKEGKVQVNGELVTEPGVKVTAKDHVTINGKKISLQRNQVYVLLNKPKGFITTTDDPSGRHTVMDIFKNHFEERIFPVGRLDRKTTGLLLLTNDGDLTQKLAHPSYKINKVYQVTLNKTLSDEDFEKIKEGVDLEDGKAPVEELAFLESKQEVGLVIHNGKNRIVRRIFESLDYQVEKLDRVMYAGLTKKDLPRGKWRFLTKQEVINLKHFR